MNIYIDEAGVFVVPSKDRCSISCVGGLVLPRQSVIKIFGDFCRLKESWGIKSDEVKGSRLSESQVNSLVTLLAQYDVIFHVVAIDMNKQSSKAISNHKFAQARNLTKNLTPEHKPGLIEGIKKLRNDLETLPSQLYVQAVCTFELVNDLLQTTTLYYAQRSPEELGDFKWYIDAKDKKVTPYEILWTTIVLPMIQSK